MEKLNRDLKAVSKTLSNLGKKIIWSRQFSREAIIFFGKCRNCRFLTQAPIWYILAWSPL